MRSRVAVVLGLVLAIGCSRAPTEGSTATTSAPRVSATSAAPDVTIRLDENGRAVVEGAPLRGDPKTCAVLKRCCAKPPSSDFGLVCGMAQAAANGDCAKALADVNAYAKESGKPACNAAEK